MTSSARVRLQAESSVARRISRAVRNFIRVLRVFHDSWNESYVLRIIFYIRALPQAGQNLSEAITGLPHFGQKPADFSLRPMRREEIMDSISSSMRSGDLFAPVLRREAMACSICAS